MILKFLFTTTLFFVSRFSFAALIYIPQKLDISRAKVIVVIHGCLQSPESMALGTGWNQKADQHNLVILYPQVPSGSNALDCWSWYLPENQQDKTGQLALIREEIATWKKRLNIGKAPVFVAGISSGAATTAGLMACFPNEFIAGAIHSGPSYGLAASLKAGEELLKSGASSEPIKRPCDPKNFKKPVMIIQGEADQVVNPKNVNLIASDFLSHASRGEMKTRQANDLKYQSEDYLYQGQLAGRIVRIEGLGHSWAGYKENLRHSEILGPNGKIPTQVPFFSSQGPSATNMIFEFFESVR